MLSTQSDNSQQANRQNRQVLGGCTDRTHYQTSLNQNAKEIKTIYTVAKDQVK